jgi:DNA recombination-dependent growth factor C
VALSLRSFCVFKLNSAALNDVTAAALAPAVIPDDIGRTRSFKGFTQWSDSLPEIVLRTNEVVVLLHGHAQKAIEAAHLNKEVRQRVAQGATDTASFRRDVRDELMASMTQKVTTFPIILDPKSELAFVGGSSADQIGDTRRQLLQLIPALGLTPPHSCACPRLCDWLKGEAPVPPNVAYGRQVDLQEPAGGGTIGYRKVALPNAEVIAHLRERGMAVVKLALVWADLLNFTVEDPLTIGSLSAINALKSQCQALQEITSESMRVEQEVHAWLRVLRPLMACLLSEFTPPPPTPMPSTPPRSPWIFDGFVAARSGDLKEI